MQLPAPRILNKIAGACTTLLHSHPEWQFHPRPSIQLNQQILIMVVVRTITSHLHSLSFVYENFLTFQLSLQQEIMARILMITEYTRIAPPTVKFQ